MVIDYLFSPSKVHFGSMRRIISFFGFLSICLGKLICRWHRFIRFGLIEVVQLEEEEEEINLISLVS
jgi:hypothetical protein